MFKKLIYIALLPVSLIFTMSGCTEWLTLKPESEVVSDDYWKTEEDVNKILMGCYYTLTSESIVYRMIAWGELRSDNMLGSFPSKREDLQRIVDGDITATNTYTKWGAFYNVINNCNILLKNAPRVVGLDQNFSETDLKRVTAEAIAIRSLCYFYLVRTFNDVPWVTTPSETDDQDFAVAKTDGLIVLDSVASNLESVKDWAATELGTNSANKGRFTQNGIYTLLADVYLWKQDYNKCISSCDKVLSDKTLELVPGSTAFISNFYTGNSKESIFEMQYEENKRENTAVQTIYGSGASSTVREITFPTPLSYDYESAITGLYSPFAYKITSTILEGEKDIRSRESYYVYGGKYNIFKYVGAGRTTSVSGLSLYSFRSTTPNWIIYRKPDVMLMKAEALAAKGDSTSLETAFSLVNDVYKRSNQNNELDRSLYKTASDVQKLVLRERHREFMFEGKRWFDLVRLARRENSVSSLNSYVNYKASGAGSSLGAPVMNAMYMPISKSELQVNKKLKQNPYYEESGNSSDRN